jgi:predicted lactoylglutathione lyase
MTTKTFINLPVKDLAKTTEFFTRLGFSFDRGAPDQRTRRMIISEDASAMLHVEPFFREFTASDIADTATSREVVVGLSTETREQVDDLVDKAVAAGGRSLGEAVDQGFMYMRAFRDLDGHQWSFLYVDMTAIPGR